MNHFPLLAVHSPSLPHHLDNKQQQYSAKYVMKDCIMCAIPLSKNVCAGNMSNWKKIFKLFQRKQKHLKLLATFLSELEMK